MIAILGIGLMGFAYWMALLAKLPYTEIIFLSLFVGGAILLARSRK